MGKSETLELLLGGERVTVSPALLETYNRPGPRYTSYPTAPEWSDEFGPGEWREELRQANRRAPAAPISLYLHVPFCRSLCLYCGCNVVIGKTTDVALAYLEALRREMDWLSAEIDPAREVEQVHWGGGTPTYLTPAQIEGLYAHLSSRFRVAADAEVSIEIDPRVTSREHCRTLRDVGFNRLSLGIQDFDPTVQKVIRRIQPYAETRALYDYCRELGFTSLNVDLIYGLPHQSVASFADTVSKIIAMRPDRVAVFSYAHVPWMKKQQGSFARFLPAGEEKFRIFASAIEQLTEAGYRYIGLDHFALPDDEICRAQDERTLRRNFQGYTTRAGSDLYGIGVSSISGLENAYAQNWRDLPHYYQAIDEGRWPTMRGVRVSEEDRLRRSVINRILCQTVFLKSDVEHEFDIRFDEHFAAELERLGELERDGLVRQAGDRIEVAPLGHIFMRNIAMIFDEYLSRPAAAQAQAFSRTL